MKFYGVSGKSYNLLKSYLDGRYQKVILSHNNGIESTWEKIKQEISQWSILGPCFFLIYINDLPNLASIKNKILLYADNTSIIVTSTNLKNFETRIDKIFGVINNWFKVTQLILNYNKTHSLQFNKIIAGIMIWNLTNRVITLKAHQIQNFWFDHWWLPIVESSYRPNEVQIEYSMFCNSNDTSYNVSRNFNKGVFCIHTFNYELRDNFLGKSIM